MKKALIFSVVLLGGLAFASIASAGNTYTMTLWGASAQYNFYKSELAAGLIQQQSGCSSATVTEGPEFKDDAGNTTYYTATCSNGNTYVVDLNARASYDGILAMQGKAVNEDKSNTQIQGVFCNPGTKAGPVFPASCNPGTSKDNCDYSYRVMTDPSGTATLSLPCEQLNCSGGFVSETNLVCKEVDVALSDVAPSSFIQSTPARSFSSGIPYPTSWIINHPMVVPFGFFASSDVTYSTCSGGTVTTGQQCSSGSQCDSGVCSGATISNISKIQILLIASGEAVNWSDFGAGYSSGNGNLITFCSRQAGSGTLATLDLGTLRRPAQPAAGPSGYVLGWAPSNPVFTDGTTAEMFCVNDNEGAIGFADADQAAKIAPQVTSSSYPNVVALKFEGIVPSRRSIRNGEYDNFYSKEWVLESNTAPDYGTWPTATTSTVTNFMTWLANPNNWPTYSAAASSFNYWATLCEMNFMKDYDYTYPYLVGANCPAGPHVDANGGVLP
jgi:hypothetical protein